mmetsp:Transcript_45903/g.92641  ORF Transcript_45903/g.92641 Transcript_45903/m.92641 type:complete len:618 (+) Transcript_45903:1-1854(+)
MREMSSNNLLGRWPNGDVVLSVGLTRESLEQQLDEVGDPGDCSIEKLPKHLLLEFKQGAPARVAKEGTDFVKVRKGGVSIPRTLDFSDFTLVSGLDGSTHHAHRIVLSSRLPTLQLDYELETFTIEGVAGPVVEALLDTVYDQAPILGCDEATAILLLSFACNIGDERLVELCESRIAKEVRELVSARGGHWPEVVPNFFGPDDRLPPPLTEVQVTKRQESSRRLLNWAALASANGAKQLLYLVEFAMSRHSADVCEGLGEEGLALLRVAVGGGFVDALERGRQQGQFVSRGVPHPAGMGAVKSASCSLAAYLAAGGALKPGDPAPVSTRQPAPQAPGEGTHPSFDPYQITVCGLEKELFTEGLDETLVPLELAAEQPYELARSTRRKMASILLPRTLRTGAALKRERDAASEDEEWDDNEELDEAGRGRLARAYSMDLNRNEDSEEQDKRTAQLMVRFERGDRTAQVALFTGNTSAGAFADTDAALGAAPFRHMTRMMGFDPSTEASGGNPLTRVTLHGLNSAELNGLTGRALGSSSSTGRVKVQLDDGRPPLMVKRENLVFGDVKINKCAYCHQQEQEGDAKFKSCARCKKATYCSPQCQKDHWKEHKRECLCVT